MPQEGHRDKLVDEVTEKVMKRPGVDAEESEVRPRVEEAVDGLVDAPVQTFTPVLAEHQVVSEVHRSHRDDVVEAADDGTDQAGDESDARDGEDDPTIPA